MAFLPHSHLPHLQFAIPKPGSNRSASPSQIPDGLLEAGQTEISILLVIQFLLRNAQ